MPETVGSGIIKRIKDLRKLVSAEETKKEYERKRRSTKVSGIINKHTADLLNQVTER